MPASPSSTASLAPRPAAASLPPPPPLDAAAPALAELANLAADEALLASWRDALEARLDDRADLQARHRDRLEDALDHLETLRQAPAAPASPLSPAFSPSPLPPFSPSSLPLAALEGIYLPYRPKKRPRATIARELGLEPLAELLLAQDPATDPLAAAAPHVGARVEVDAKVNAITSPAEALAGARDILAERFADDAAAREKVRALYRASAVISSKVLLGKETEGAKFKDYFDWSEPLATAPSHRILAMRRGEKELFLMMRITLPDESLALAELERLFVLNGSPAAAEVRLATADSFKRLLAPALETEMRLDAKKRADLDAIKIFTSNLRELLLTSPLGQKVVLALDPGFRTGCKAVILDRQGKLLHHDVIYPDRHAVEAQEKVRGFVDFFKIEALAIGNGTGGRETEGFMRALGLPPAIPIVMVNESGASIYSASDVAREEFPDHDLTVRGAVSIGRRLMDPLAELVKLDPKSIGVGQYQHDVDQAALKRSLDDTVVSSVNGVGVELNTASKQLLAYVSGLNSATAAATAAAIVARRDAAGPFTSRAQLLDVPRLGPKAFEQAAGFLRIRDAAHPLDRSAVHPERYPLVERMAADLGLTVADLMADEKARARIKLETYVSPEVGLPTLKDIVTELAKPGRDPRAKFEAFAFEAGVNRPEDLRPGMKLPGIVTNVTAFGAFVDIGVHQDGLVHVSQLADTFVKDPAAVVKPQQKVTVTVVEVDLARNRIALSMRSTPELVKAAPRSGPASRGAGRSPARPGDRRPSPGAPSAPKTLNNDWFSAALSKKK